MRGLTLAAVALGASTLPMSVLAQTASSENTDDTDDIVVSALRQTTTVAKQGVEIRDLPQAITIIPKAELDEAAVKRFDDISYNTVGITPYIPFAGAEPSGGFSRGFSANSLIDGYRSGLLVGLSVVDRVEVVRGPTSVLYGQG